MPFVLFVVEPFLSFAGQRELSREKPGERSVEGQVCSLLFHGDAPFRISQKAPLFNKDEPRMNTNRRRNLLLVVRALREYLFPFHCLLT